MPDMTMCTSETCDMKECCYRATAKPDKLQSYSNFKYICNKDSGFEYFMSDYKGRRFG